VPNARPADHDAGHDQAPERQQDEAGHDNQHQADRDADGGQDRRAGDRQDKGDGGPVGLADVQVDPAVSDVLHRLDQRRLEQEGRGEIDDLGEDIADDPGQREQGEQDGCDQVDHERDEQEVGRVLAVQGPRLGQYSGERTHEGIL